MADLQAVGEKIRRMDGTDKVFGLIIALGALGLLGWALMFVLPIALILAQQTIYLLAELGIILGVLFFGPKMWPHINLAWESLSISISRAIIKKNPVNILTVAINRLTAKQKELSENIGNLKGAKKRQESDRDGWLAMMQNEIKLMQAAKAAKKPQETVTLHAENAATWETNIKGIVPRIESASKMIATLERAYNVCGLRLSKCQTKKQAMVSALDSSRESKKAFDKAMAFFGRSDEMKLYEASCEVIDREVSDTLGQIDEFTRIMNPELDAADLQKEADGMAALEKFSKYLDGELDGKPLLEATITEVLPVSVPTASTNLVTKR